MVSTIASGITDQAISIGRVEIPSLRPVALGSRWRYFMKKIRMVSAISSEKKTLTPSHTR